MEKKREMVLGDILPDKLRRLLIPGRDGVSMPWVLAVYLCDLHARQKHGVV